MMPSTHAGKGVAITLDLRVTGVGSKWVVLGEAEDQGRLMPLEKCAGENQHSLQEEQ